jgi:hypothetical protein
VGQEVAVVVRPEALAFGGGLVGRVTERRFAGPVSYFQVALDGEGEIEVLAAPGAAAVGDVVQIGLDPKGPPPRAFPLHGSPFSRSGGGRWEKGTGDEVGGGRSAPRERGT